MSNNLLFLFLKSGEGSMKADQVSYKLRNLVLLATALTFLFVCRLPHSFGINYYALGIYSNTLIQSPTVILVDGSDDVSYVYTNNTSAKISINATLTELTYHVSSPKRSLML